MKKSFVIITLMVVAGLAAMAQPAGPGKGMREHSPLLADRIPDLTEDQRDQIHELRKSFMEYSLEKRAKLKVLHSEYEYLLISDEKDLNALDRNIEERIAIRAEMMKEKTRMRLSIRDLLTEEQQVIFDYRILMQAPGKHQRGNEGRPLPPHAGGKRG